jgi:hypothetical protein
MVARVRLWWKKIKAHPIITLLIPFLVALFLTIIMGGYRFNWSWTGFIGDKEKYKTLYDWMQLLIIPAVLAIAGYIINLTISRGEQEATKQRDQTDRHIELDRQHEATLKEYIDKMSRLILHNNLCDSTKGDDVRKIADIWTGLALSRLDAKRKRHLVDFLRISKLIEANNIVDLSRANLSEVDLLDKNLSGLNFSGAYMREANLTNADLSKTNFREAEFKGANLSDANLIGADFSYANLTKAKVTPEQLVQAKSLKGTTMPDGSIHQ